MVFWLGLKDGSIWKDVAERGVPTILAEGGYGYLGPGEIPRR